MGYPRSQLSRNFKKVIGDMSGNHTTTSTTFVDIAAAYTGTLKAQVGDVLRCVLNLVFTNSGAQTQYFRFNIAGTAQGPAIYGAVYTGGFDHPLHFEYWHTIASGDLTSGFVTVKPQYRTLAGTCTVRNEGTTFGAPVFAVHNLGPADPN